MKLWSRRRSELSQVCIQPSSYPSISYVYLGFELVDVSESLPSLIRRPGLTKWLPTVDRDMKYVETYDDYIASLAGGMGAARLARSHWPPTEDPGLERWYVHLAWHRKILVPNISQYTHISAPAGYRGLFHCRIAAQAINSGAKV